MPADSKGCPGGSVLFPLPVLTGAAQDMSESLMGVYRPVLCAAHRLCVHRQHVWWGIFRGKRDGLPLLFPTFHNALSTPAGVLPVAPIDTPLSPRPHAARARHSACCFEWGWVGCLLPCRPCLTQPWEAAGAEAAADLGQSHGGMQAQGLCLEGCIQFTRCHKIIVHGRKWAAHAKRLPVQCHSGSHHCDR